MGVSLQVPCQVPGSVTVNVFLLVVYSIVVVVIYNSSSILLFSDYYYIKFVIKFKKVILISLMHFCSLKNGGHCTAAGS